MFSYYAPPEMYKLFYMAVIETNHEIVTFKDTEYKTQKINLLKR